jgi:hypothetical protein
MHIFRFERKQVQSLLFRFHEKQDIEFAKKTHGLPSTAAAYF